MKRLLIFFGIVAAFLYAWGLFKEVPLRVVGQPTSTGLLQHAKEQPFFERLSELSGLPLQVQYRPLDATGLMDTFQLKGLQSGTFDLVSLRFLQNSELEPSLQGIDLVGLNSDYETAQAVIGAYSPTVDAYLQEHFKSKLLGIWSFGPQEIFCRVPIGQLADLKGLKVRVGSATLASFISELGGTPAVISFDDTVHALASGLVDCAVTSAASANFAGWPKHALYYYPLAVHFGLNGYAISLKKWDALSSTQQVQLQATFDTYLADLWAYTRAIHRDAALCNVGGECQHGKAYSMVRVAPHAADVARLRDMTQRSLLAEWGARCDRVRPGCLATWRAKVGALMTGTGREPS